MKYKSVTDEDVVTDQNFEVKSWQDRIEFKRSVLSRPWKLPTSVLSQQHPRKPSNDISIRQESKDEAPSNAKAVLRKIDFTNLPLAAHSIRNLKLLLLSHIKSLQRFTPNDLFALEHIQHAATCVARRDQPRGFTDRDATNTLLATLNLLLRDGNIIISRPNLKDGANTKIQSSMDEMYIVVGTWNLSTTVKAIAKKENKLIVRDVWKKITAWGNGWETTTKGVVGVVVEEVLLGLQGQEWVESKSGVWTRVDV